MDRILPAYQSCSFELTEKDFASNDYNAIRLYVDSPRTVYAFIESCKTEGEQLCDTSEYIVGLDYSLKYAPEWAVRIIFENDESEDAIFQIDVQTTSGQALGAMNTFTALSSSTFALLAASILF